MGDVNLDWNFLQVVANSLALIPMSSQARPAIHYRWTHRVQALKLNQQHSVTV